ncbi:unnamed protein product [Rotaria socialis]|uniref:YHYH domain-containing protein n=1 Tax=Rotaria socialis TaxID=392032 RepID=A0A820S6J6_9BILA|nr:unnamed protein product [Rotaria socialis]
MMMFITTVLFIFGLHSVQCTVSNSLANCNIVAAKSNSTCNEVVVTSITATTGIAVICTFGFTASTCPDNYFYGTCMFVHKLCVTCSGSSTVRIRVQTNVDFNPDVSINSPLYTPITTSQFTSGYLNILAGVSVYGVTLLNANSANNVDPFYPAGGFSAETVDACLGHPSPVTNEYHYHAGFGCALDPPSGAILYCAGTTACSTSVANYSIAKFSNHRNLTVTSGFAICNGMFNDSIGNYGYFVTRTYPYVTGCFGPGNYPNASVNCSTNAPSSYSKSVYALNLISTTTLITSTLNQTTRANNYFGYQNSSTVQITLSSSAHTAWQSTSNCSVQQCNISLNNDNNCRSSSIPCYNYLSFNSTSYCAPGILCSILQSCYNVALSCGSNDFVCIVNSCCTPQPVCLPILFTSFCPPGNEIREICKVIAKCYVPLLDFILFYDIIYQAMRT